MPRGIDRRNDPRNDLTREGIRARLVSQTELTRDAIPGVRISNYTDPLPEGENRYFSHEDPEEERIERKQEQYREEGPDWGI